MTQESAPISDQAPPPPPPDNFDSILAIFSGDWSEVHTSNGGTSGAYMHAGVRTSRTSRPFRSMPFSLFGGLPGEKAFAIIITPTSAHGLRILFGSLDRDRKEVRLERVVCQPFHWLAEGGPPASVKDISTMGYPAFRASVLEAGTPLNVP